VLVTLLVVALPLHSIGQRPSERLQKVRVGVKVDPPYIIKDADGSYYGMCPDLWYKLASELNIAYEFVEYTHLQDMIFALSSKKIDLAINALPISGTRLRQLEVTHPFLTSSVGIAIRKTGESQIEIFLSNLFSLNFLKLLAFLIFIVFIFGVIVWFAEKKYNPADFRDGIYGVMDGLWWSTVTITTVGYGDKTPKTTLGKVISMIWMFLAISLISSFTATITTTLTVNQLELDVDNMQDLQRISRVGTITNSDTEDYLRRHQIAISESYIDPLKGLEALREGDIKVFVYDKAVIRYLLTEYEMEGDIRMLPVNLNHHYLSWLLTRDNPLFPIIDPVIADELNKDSWEKMLKKYNLTDFR
jgi:ABC-type amino acid transport substrate-binding protein